MGAIWMMVALIVLMGLDIGNLFWQKRELQKIADMAALAGVQGTSAGCATVQSYAQSNAQLNGLRSSGVNADTFLPADCGNWDPSQPPVIESGVNCNPACYFDKTRTPVNAVRVTVSRTVPYFFVFNWGSDGRLVKATATATQGSSIAAFSVGTKLVELSSDSELGKLLGRVGIDANGTSLVGYDGLADINITPGGLLAALGLAPSLDGTIGGVNSLLDQKITLDRLLNAIAEVAGQENLLKADITALTNLISSRTGLAGADLLVQLGSTLNESGLLVALNASNQQAALGAQINALDLIATAVSVATKKHAVELNLDALPSALQVATVKTALIEPASIAAPAVVGTTQRTSQVRSFIHIQSAPLSKLPLIGSLFSSTLQLNLPIAIDVVNGSATLEEMCTANLRDRHSDHADRARFSVQGSIARVCVGNFNESTVFSNTASCDTGLQNAQLLKLSLLGKDLLNLNTSFSTSPLPASGSLELKDKERSSVGNELLLGDTVRNILNELMLKLLTPTVQQNGSISADQRKAMAEDLWGSPACTTLTCRVNRMQQIKGQIETANQQIGGIVGGLLSSTVDALGSLVTLDVFSTVGGLLGGVLGAVTDILGGLVGGCTAILFSSDQSCINELANSLAKQSSGASNPNALIGMVVSMAQMLEPMLNALGSAILTPVLQKIVGAHVGQIEVHLRTLNCASQPLLVY